MVSDVPDAAGTAVPLKATDRVTADCVPTVNTRENTPGEVPAVTVAATGTVAPSDQDAVNAPTCVVPPAGLPNASRPASAHVTVAF